MVLQWHFCFPDGVFDFMAHSLIPPPLLALGIRCLPTIATATALGGSFEMLYTTHQHSRVNVAFYWAQTNRIDLQLG